MSREIHAPELPSSPVGTAWACPRRAGIPHPGPSMACCLRGALPPTLELPPRGHIKEGHIQLGAAQPRAQGV